MARQKRKGKVKALRVDIDQDLFDDVNIFIAKLNKESETKIYLYNIIEEALKEYFKNHKEDVE